jgi:hypothetical protein
MDQPTQDDIYTAIRNADKAGDSDSVRKLGAYLQTMQPAAAPEATPTPSFGDKVEQQAGNLGAGLIRGAGSIGATLLTPIDAAASAMGIHNDFIGRTDRRDAMDDGLQTLGADPTSIAYKGGKLAAEVAGTAGAGGVVARGAALIPGVARAAPALIDAVGSAGFKAGGATGAAGVATRAAGGAIAGGASAGLVDPKDAPTGALIGGVLPGAVQLAGTAGRALTGAAGTQTAEQLAAVDAARKAGYIIPPTQAKPSVVNKILEGFSGKLTTAQNASAANQPVTNGLAAKALGLSPDTQITPDVLQAIRNKAGQSYDAIGNTGTVTPGPAYGAALDQIAASAKTAAAGFPNAKPSPVIDLVDSLRSPSFDASSAVAKIKELRSAADDAFRSGNTDVARASKSAANALEGALSDHLTQAGNPQALTDFQDARQLIAKTYSVQKAMNPTTGSIDANKLAGQLAKGKPLSGELLDAAQFAQRFPKAAKVPEPTGGLPGTSPLDWAMGGGIAAATHNPLALIGVAARPLARKFALSDLVQNRLGTVPPNAQLSRLSDLLGQGSFRAAPVIGADR